MTEEQEIKEGDLVFLPKTDKGKQIVQITNLERLEEFVPDTEEHIGSWSDIKAIQAIQADGTPIKIERSQIACKMSLEEAKMLVEQGEKLIQRQSKTDGRHPDHFAI